MKKSNGSSSAEAHHADAEMQHEAAPEADLSETPQDNTEAVATLATVAVVGLGAVVFEAALLPGLVLGVAAMWLPKYFPKMGEAINPLLRSTVRGAYRVGRKTKEMMAEAQEQVHDIVAEVHAEGEGAAKTVATAQG